jgi:hypothetical protein
MMDKQILCKCVAMMGHLGNIRFRYAIAIIQMMDSYVADRIASQQLEMYRGDIDRFKINNTLS